MVTNIQQAVQPLLVTSSIIGLGIYSWEKSRPYRNILCSLIVWIAYLYFCVYLVIELKIKDWYLKITSVFHIQIGIIVTFASIIMVIYHDKKFRRFMKRLADVDDTLEKLGIPKMYRKLQLRVKGMIILWFVYSCVANINDMLWWASKTDDRRILIVPYITNHFRHVNVFVDITFVIFVWYIGTEFDKVNEHIKYLLMRDERGLRCTWRKTLSTVRRYMYTKNYKHVLWTSMHLHLELCQIARELNKMYGLQMTLEVALHLFYIATMFIYLYKNLTTENYRFKVHLWLDTHFWLAVHGIRIFYINYSCESVTAKASKIKTIIHQLTDHLRYADIRDEIYQFTLQLMYHPLRFTGMGLFCFGYRNLRKSLLTVVAFVLFATQLSKNEA